MTKGKPGPEDNRHEEIYKTEKGVFAPEQMIPDAIKSLKALKLSTLTEDPSLAGSETENFSQAKDSWSTKLINILLVEDNIIDATIYRKMLSNQKNFKVTHVENASSAVASLSKGGFELILLDLSLPDEEGFNTFTRLSDHAPDIPIVVLTGLDNEELALKIMQSGAQDYLLKGNVNRELLIRSVRYAIERYKLLEKIYNLSLIDELTGLYNRRAFMIIGERYLKLAKRQTCNMLLFFIDLDNMKKINDNYGHLEGDNAIKNAAGILKRTFRDSDLLARMGGDEFTALMFIEELETGFSSISHRLQESIADFNSNKDNLYQVALSVGAVHCQVCNETSLQELMDRADNSLYEHKKMKNDKNRSFINLIK